MTTNQRNRRGGESPSLLEGLPRPRRLAAVVVMALAFTAAAGAAETRVEPDDTRLVDVVRLIESGMSESIIAEHLQQSGQTYKLSVNDLLYLRQNKARESTIAALMATDVAAAAKPVTPPVAAPTELIFEDLVLVKSGMLKGDRKGRLVLEGDTLGWEGRRKRKDDFTFQTSGLEKVWFTCEARAAENFCYQINFKIVKGDRYRFRDLHGDSGSNVAITAVMEALRLHHPRLDFAAATSN